MIGWHLYTFMFCCQDSQISLDFFGTIWVHHFLSRKKSKYKSPIIWRLPPTISSNNVIQFKYFNLIEFFNFNNVYEEKKSKYIYKYILLLLLYEILPWFFILYVCVCMRVCACVCACVYLYGCVCVFVCVWLLDRIQSSGTATETLLHFLSQEEAQQWLW